MPEMVKASEMKNNINPRFNSAQLSPHAPSVTPVPSSRRSTNTRRGRARIPRWSGNAGCSMSYVQTRPLGHYAAYYPQKLRRLKPYSPQKEREGFNHEGFNVLCPNTTPRPLFTGLFCAFAPRDWSVNVLCPNTTPRRHFTGQI
jgi:hypothetical protein